MSATAQPIEPPTFTADAARAAQSVHNWTRFAALVTATAGTLLLVVTLILSGVVASKYPAMRGLIAGIGTAYAAIALAMLCFAFLLVRYGQKLELAAKQRRSAPLVEALPYETGAWAIAAGYVAVWVLAVVVSLLAPATQPFVNNGGAEVTAPAEQSAPVASGIREAIGDGGELEMVNLVCGGFGVLGLVLVVAALRPV